MPTALPAKLPLEGIPPDVSFYRIHRLANAPVWFGTWSPGSLQNRFDDPAGIFGVCYLGGSSEAAFAESLLRRQPARFVSLSDLAARGIAEVVTTREVTVVPLFGSALAAT